MNALQNVAVMAARRGGAILIRQIPKLQKLKVEKKGHNDFVSDADRAAEAAVIEVIKNHYPDHAILAEESGPQGESDTVWIIDPLDGTTNFLHGFPQFCVSVGVQVKGRKEMEYALIGTGFPFRQTDEDMTPYLNMLGKVVKNTAGVRRPGAAALDLSYVAAGRLDGFWETGLKSWDVAAGSLIIREAGGIVSGLDGSENYLDAGHILCGTPNAESVCGTRQTLRARDQGNPPQLIGYPSS
jgi:myo-inositol-1(or 4)-monophosphatase